MAKVKTIEERNKELALQGLTLKLYGMKFRANPNTEQIKYFNQTIGASRFTFNYYLNEKKEVYHETGESLDYTTFKKAYNALKTHPFFCWLKQADKFALENAMMDVDDAFTRFFKGQNQYPKFKKKHDSKQSYTTNMTNNNIKLNVAESTIQLPKTGKVSIRISKKWRKLLKDGLNGTIKSATVRSMPDGKFDIALKIEEIVPLKKPLKLDEIVDDQITGYDLGLTHFLIDSNGLKIDNPKYYQKTLKHLVKHQRHLSKMAKGSNNYNKQKHKVAKIHQRIANMRRDFLHKQSRQVVNENQIIILEDLNVKGMIKNHHLAKSIQDVGWGTFVQYVTYKAAWCQKTVVRIDRWFPSSKLCDGCREKHTLLSLSDRVWVCPNCGKTHDRDQTAAKNIKTEGLRLLKARQESLQPS